MGLCKCPKKQVSNQFCFEHRVTVCEHCMIQTHPKCIIQSYLKWLDDSEYIPNCTLCSSSLDQGECVRLVCFHVFHWDCLNARQAALPANTAPAGHLCPTCNVGIFPKPNLVSPVADALKAQLSQVNWGRNGLGLSLLPEEQNFKRSSAIASKVQTPSSSTASNVTKIHHATNERTKTNGAFPNSTMKHDSPHSVLLMDAFNPPSDDIYASSRRPLLPRQPPIGGSDRDENKYKRRTPAEIFSRWSRRFYAPSSRPPWKRTWFLVLTGIIGFILLIYIMAFFGRGDSNESSFDDSWNNPNPNPHQNPKPNRHYD